MTTVNGKPIFSSSEEVAYKTCKLGHHFQYVLGYGPKVTNQKLNDGIQVHEGMEVIYKGGTISEALERLHDLSEDRWEELQAGYSHLEGGVPASIIADYIKSRDMVMAMVEGYPAWAEAVGIDDDYETVAVEEHHYIDIPEAPCVMPIKLDLLQRNKRSGKLRIVDFKTAKSFTSDVTKYQLSEQNGNYQLGIMAVYGERPTELQYRELRKIIPSGRSKPPYYRAIGVRLTPEEMLYRKHAYVQTATERFSDQLVPVPNPSACCGSWKNDWQAPCRLVHQGYDPQIALDNSPGYEPQDNYARYEEATK